MGEKDTVLFWYENFFIFTGCKLLCPEKIRRVSV
jgi:hypothetical protein